jgi:hypothetical protein
MNTTFRNANIAFALTLCGLAGYRALAQSNDEIPFPSGYRQWVHLKSTVLSAQPPLFAKDPCTKPCVGGMHNFYANEKALEGYRTGKFPEGAVIVDDLLERKEVSDNSEVSVEGTRRGVAIMVKDSQRFAATGGWGFDFFKGESRAERATPEQAKGCANCHRQRKDHDYTFITYQE